MSLSPFPFSDTNKRYHTIDWHLKHTYGTKVAKIPLDAGFTCPNRDGTKGTGGCSFCSARGSGDTVLKGDLRQQYEAGLARTRSKWPDCKGIAYFQAYTNTYAGTQDLIELYAPVFAWPDVEEISIATRPDCLQEDFVIWLKAQSKPVWIELGLQSSNEKTMASLNRKHGNDSLASACSMLCRHGIPFCLHLINGLPGETRQDMLETVDFAVGLKPAAIKIHMLHLIKGTALAGIYALHPFPLLELDEYVSIVCDQLERIPAEVVIERVTGDAVADDLVAPLWTRKKTIVANEIDKELVRRNSMQGLYTKGTDF